MTPRSVGVRWWACRCRPRPRQAKTRGIPLTEVGNYEVGDGVTVRIEFDPGVDFQPAGADEILGTVREAIEPALLAAQMVIERAREASPDEVSVKFGIKVSGEANWLLARAATEANFEISMMWKPGEAAAS